MIDGEKNKTEECIAWMLKNRGFSLRYLPMGEKSIFFCKRNREETFDISVSDQGQVRVWSYIADGIPKEYFRRHWDYQADNEENTVIGLEVTGEGVLNFYFYQELPVSGKEKEDTDRCDRFMCRLEGYIYFLKGLKAVLKEEGANMIGEDSTVNRCGKTAEGAGAGAENTCSDRDGSCRDADFDFLFRRMEEVFCKAESEEENGRKKKKADL